MLTPIWYSDPKAEIVKFEFDINANVHIHSASASADGKILAALGYIGDLIQKVREGQRMFTKEQLDAIDARLLNVVNQITAAATKETDDVKLLIKAIPNISQADMDTIFAKIDGIAPAMVAAVDKISNDASANTGDAGGGGAPQP